jgi:hypothetical protein
LECRAIPDPNLDLEMEAERTCIIWEPRILEWGALKGDRAEGTWQFPIRNAFSDQ